MGFSRSGLIEQLEFEGFSEEDAEFAVDSLDVDWMEQAAIVAESYLENMHFSRQGLIDQLEFEGFTTEQAEYGVTETGL
jgi:colicin import membrane protein